MDSCINRENISGNMTLEKEKQYNQFYQGVSESIKLILIKE